MRRGKTTITTTVACLGLALLIGSNGSVLAKVTRGKSRPLATKQLMKGLVAAQCGALAKGLKASPSDDETWAAVAMHAALLNEASYILMADDRCPDATWADAATKTLRGGSVDLLKAIEAKDLAKAKRRV